MQRALALENSPALTVALPFFLNVPVFTVLCGLLALWQGPDLFVSHLSPGSLAATHLLVLGALASAMFGGLLQILPVATGIRAAAPQLTATLVHGLLVCGTLLLAGGFLAHKPVLFGAAVIALVPASLMLLLSLAAGGWRHRKQVFKAAAEVVQTAGLALCALAVTVAAGMTLAGNHAGWWLAPAAFRGLHPLWGLLGWLGLLVMGMSFQLIPIFQATEIYPRWMTRYLGPLIMTLLTILSAQTLLPASWWSGHTLWALTGVVLCIALACFAAVTLQRLITRKRPAPDITTAFWLTGMVSLAGALLLWAVALLGKPVPPLLTGSLVVIGFGLSVVNGMLYKIIPFLLWFAMQRTLKQPLPGLPKVKDMLPERWGWAHYAAHTATLTLLAAACLGISGAATATAAGLMLSGILQVLNSVRALTRYKQAKRYIQAWLKHAEASAGVRA
jgi:hypothetical protein